MTGACRCGGPQSSHQRLLSVFGGGLSIVQVTATILVPGPGATICDHAAVQALAGSKRGVSRLERWLNGTKWGSYPGAAFGALGQPNPSNYALVLPDDVPSSIIDVVVKAYDDLGIEGDSSTVTVTKGAPCTTATSCAVGQRCDQGRCFRDAPTGELGQPCTYNQFCTSNECAGAVGSELCTQACTVGVADACPTGFDCLNTTGTPLRWPTPAENGGGCSSSDTPIQWPQISLEASRSVRCFADAVDRTDLQLEWSNSRHDPDVLAGTRIESILG